MCGNMQNLQVGCAVAAVDLAPNCKRCSIQWPPSCPQRRATLRRTLARHTTMLPSFLQSLALPLALAVLPKYLEFARSLGLCVPHNLRLSVSEPSQGWASFGQVRSWFGCIAASAIAALTA